MGKRSDFPRRERDFYPTPFEAVKPLAPFIPYRAQVHEPCAGKGDLWRHLVKLKNIDYGHLGDIEFGNNESWRKNWGGIWKEDALTLTDCCGEMFITNPPWAWDILDKLIPHLSNIAPTWLLLSADLMHNKRMAPHMARCAMIISVGRVKWIPDSPYTGKDNACWYLFLKYRRGPTEFIARNPEL